MEPTTKPDKSAVRCTSVMGGADDESQKPPPEYYEALERVASKLREVWGEPKTFKDEHGLIVEAPPIANVEARRP